MISLVRILPRTIIEELAKPEHHFRIQKKWGNWVLVSIYGTGSDIDTAPLSDKVKLGLKQAGCTDILQLQFDDVEAPGGGMYSQPFEAQFKAPSRDDAAQIIEFVDKWKDGNCQVETLISHCRGGISRSGAVGTWANEYLGLNPTDFKVHNPMVIPNATLLQWLRYLTFVHSGKLHE